MATPSNTSAYTVGTAVEILMTNNVAARFPELVGSLAVVDVIPIHPSTWYTLTVHLTGRQIKLQNTAMKVVPKGRLQAAAAQHGTDPLVAAAAAAVAGAGGVTSSTTPSVGGRSRSNSVTCGIASFVQGVSVRILPTEHVLHRCPHLVGCVGTIVEVPVHPITWFKVAFPDGNVATFRPSAFKVAGDGDAGDEVDDGRYAALPPKRSARAPSVVYDVDDDATGLSVGTTVRIREGRLVGALGEVLRLGNGWVQVRTDYGEVSKRAHELEPSADGTYRGRSLSFAASGVTATDRRFHGARGSRLRSSTYDAAAAHPRKHARAEFVIAMDEDGHITAAPSLAPPGGNSGVARDHRDHTETAPPIPFLYDLERQVEDCPFPLIDLSQRQAKRARLQDVVNRESEAVLGRPNLSLWLTRLRRTLCDDDDEDDEEDTAKARRGVRAPTPVSPAATAAAAATEEASEVSEMSSAAAAAATAAAEPRTVTFDASTGSIVAGVADMFVAVPESGPASARVERTHSESDWSDVHVAPSALPPQAVAAAGTRPARSDSMAADTDNEDAFSPELAGIAAIASADQSPPLLRLPPPALGAVGAKGLPAPAPMDYMSWTKLVATAGDGAYDDAI